MKKCSQSKAGMNTTKILLILIFLPAFLFSCGTEKVEKREDTSSRKDSIIAIEGTLQGKPIKARVNSVYKNFTRKSEFPFHLMISIDMKEKDEQGFPSANESAALIAVEEYFFKKLSDTTRYHFVGRNDWNGWREMLFYVDDPNAAAAMLNKISQETNPIREFEFRIMKDDNWQGVENYFKENLPMKEESN